jgi:Fur family transcriptional regulator, ferric uptake regulator
MTTPTTASVTASSSLKPNSLKLNLTRAQRQIHLVLERADQAMTAQSIYQTLQEQQQTIGLATVYRSLHSLQIKGLAQARALTNGEWVYGLTSDDSHYLTCLNCGTSVPVEECPVHALEEKLTESSQFQIFYHTLEFFGLCLPCRCER